MHLNRAVLVPILFALPLARIAAQEADDTGLSSFERAFLPVLVEQPAVEGQWIFAHDAASWEMSADPVQLGWDRKTLAWDPVLEMVILSRGAMGTEFALLDPESGSISVAQGKHPLVGGFHATGDGSAFVKLAYDKTQGMSGPLKDFVVVGLKRDERGNPGEQMAVPWQQVYEMFGITLRNRPDLKLIPTVDRTHLVWDLGFTREELEGPVQERHILLQDLSNMEFVSAVKVPVDGSLSILRAGMSVPSMAPETWAREREDFIWQTTRQARGERHWPPEQTILGPTSRGAIVTYRMTSGGFQQTCYAILDFENGELTPMAMPPDRRLLGVSGELGSADLWPVVTLSDRIRMQDHRRDALPAHEEIVGIAPDLSTVLTRESYPAPNFEVAKRDEQGEIVDREQDVVVTRFRTRALPTSELLGDFAVVSNAQPIFASNDGRAVAFWEEYALNVRDPRTGRLLGSIPHGGSRNMRWFKVPYLFDYGAGIGAINEVATQMVFTRVPFETETVER